MEPTQKKEVPHDEHEHEKNKQKNYIKSNKKWNYFKIHEDIVEALYDQGKPKPTRVQEETLEVATNPDRKKFNMLIRAANGSGKTMSFLVPILNSLEPGLKTAEDKTFKGKVQHNEIFKPQGVIIVQTVILQEQIEQILKLFVDFGKTKNSEKLNFTIGRMAKDKHEHGDIIVCMPKSFLNRSSRGNLNLQNCKFVAIDQVDDIFDQDRQTLAEVLSILEKSRPNVLTCSATMKKEFLDFYEKHSQDVIKTNVNQIVENEMGGKQRITLEGVKNYYNVIQDNIDIHKYVIKTLFKHLYGDTTNAKPQVFIFFNSVDKIEEFDTYFKSIASDFTTDESKYLADLSVGKIAAKKYEDGKKVDSSADEKRSIMKKFRNNETNILLATNIIARGIDVRNCCFVINIGPPKQNKEIDLDIYLHRVGRTGRHNDKGIAITFACKQQIEKLTSGIKKIHKIDILEMKNPESIVLEVKECIKANAE